MANNLAVEYSDNIYSYTPLYMLFLHVVLLFVLLEFLFVLPIEPEDLSVLFPADPCPLIIFKSYLPKQLFCLLLSTPCLSVAHPDFIFESAYIFLYVERQFYISLSCYFMYWHSSNKLAEG